MQAPPGPPLVLASASPRRRDLLRGLGLHFEVSPAEVDETARPDERAADLARRLAADKADRVRAAHTGSLVLAADTVVLLQDGDREELLGKPSGPQEASAMLHRLSGRRHQVLTGLAMAPPGGRRPLVDMAMTTVTFRRLSDALIQWYVSGDEPYDKAGAYGVQGRAALFVSRLEGSWTNVVGLPLDRLDALFRAAGHPLENYLRTPS